MTPSRWWQVIDLLFLLALAAFVLVGTPLASFHGDEPMQIYMSGDYDVAIVQGNPRALETNPPYYIDFDPQLRILNGSVNRYSIGLARAIAGLSAEPLPPRPGWDWGLSYDENVNTGHRPSDALMLAGRLPSSLFLAASVFAMFGLAWQFGGSIHPTPNPSPNSERGEKHSAWEEGQEGISGKSRDTMLKRPLAYVVTTLYTLNPIILLNGRRALQEGSLLFFGLLVILTAVVIARRRASGQHVPVYTWIGLILAGAMTMASKHNGVVFVAAAFGWVFVGELTHFRLRQFVLTTLMLIGCGLVVIALFVALSPALWNDPVARLGDLLAVRANLLDIQTQADPLAPTALNERIERIVTEPFLASLAHYEVASWASFAPVTAEIERYMASPLSGFQFGNVLGLILTALAVVGLIVLFVPALRPYTEWASSLGLLAWLSVTIASLLANPLPWQRYYLPLIPVASLLAGIGLIGIGRAFIVRYQQAIRLRAGAH